MRDQHNLLAHLEQKPLPPQLSFDEILRLNIQEQMEAEFKLQFPSTDEKKSSNELTILSPLLRDRTTDILVLLGTAREACTQRGKYFPTLEKFIDRYIDLATAYKKQYAQMTHPSLDTDAALRSPSSGSATESKSPASTSSEPSSPSTPLTPPPSPPPSPAKR